MHLVKLYIYTHTYINAQKNTDVLFLLGEQTTFVHICVAFVSKNIMITFLLKVYTQQHNKKHIKSQRDSFTFRVPVSPFAQLKCKSPTLHQKYYATEQKFCLCLCHLFLSLALQKGVSRNHINSYLRSPRVSQKRTIFHIMHQRCECDAFLRHSLSTLLPSLSVTLCRLPSEPSHNHLLKILLR